MKTLIVQSKNLPSGFQVTCAGKVYRVTYPRPIWNALAATTKTLIADTAAHFFTRHFGLIRPTTIRYDFPVPAAYSFFQHGLFYALPEAVLEFPKAHFSTASLMKQAYNSDFTLEFTGQPPVDMTQAYVPKARTGIMAFSFGKDSLLTYAVTREIGLTVTPFFFLEPTSTYENVNKRILAKAFKKEFADGILQFDNTLGELREGDGVMWGWDLLLTQYTLLLAPYTIAQKSQYFFWSNERSTNEKSVTPDGYTINPTHEQSVQWTTHLTNLLRTFHSSATVTTLLEPIHELAVMYILHHRYPDIGKYQLSCLNDTDKPVNKRWCGDCFECARVFMFLLAIGIDPARVGFADNMLDPRKLKHHNIFDKKTDATSIDFLFQSEGERLLSYYLAYKRGVRTGLMQRFEKTLLGSAKKQEKKLLSKYIAVYAKPQGIPQELQKNVLSIYTKEVKQFLKDITAVRPAPVEISV